jgi:hypothetical protein
VREDAPDDQRVFGVEAALEGFSERREFLAKQTAREIGHERWVGGPGDERVEPRAAGAAHHVGGHQVELDAGVLHDLVQPVHLALAIADLRLATARQVLSVRIGFGGTRLARSSPASSSWHSH